MKLVVIGGVAAGMSAAARARRLNEDAEIVVLERGDDVSFANCGLPYHVGGVIADRGRLLLQTPASLRASLNLDVRTRHEVTAIDRARRVVQVRDLEKGRDYEEAYDKLVLAPGAAPLRPPIPGIESARILTLRNLADMDRIQAAITPAAKRVAVIGAGYIGLEMAENLRHRGLEVEIIELADQILPLMDAEMVRGVEAHLRAQGVSLHLAQSATAFKETAGGLAVVLPSGAEVAADFVVLSVGVRPDVSLARAAGLELGARGGIKVDAHQRTSDPDIYAAGDAVEVVDAVLGGAALIPLAGPANRQGRVAADHLCGRAASPYPGTQGTAIAKVFDMTLGGTGASEKGLRRAGVPYRKVYVHPGGHAGYYPGTAPMHLKLLFAPDTGRLLGAQVAGFDGVDKRIDVLATALRAGMTVFDLEHLELAYAPPYGSAKDPVNMAGFVASNLLRGDLDLWYAEQFPAATADGTVLDVRTRHEYDTWHIPGALNIPLHKLRGSLEAVPKDRPVFVYCKVGFRSYLAYRILKQKGFKAATLSGGSDTFRAVHQGRELEEEPELAPDRPTPVETAAGPATPAPSADQKPVEVDCRGLQCPGPIRKLKEALEAAPVGAEICARATDQGFAADAPAWAKNQGHEVLAVRQAGAVVEVRLRKTSAAPAGAPSRCERAPGARDKKTMVVFSGDLDKVLASFILANGAAAMGSEVTMFFTFWGLNALRRDQPQAAGKGLLDRMFGLMMPRGPDALKLSKMNMGGMGTAMMKHVMRKKNVDSLPALIAQARQAGVRLVVCTMSMDVMGLKKEELVDGLEFGGVAAFWGESSTASAVLFI